MNRREFLRKAAIAVAALKLARLPKVEARAEPETLFGIPIKYEKPGATVHTGWIDCTRYEDLTLIPGSGVIDVNLADAHTAWQLPEADRGWHVIEVKMTSCEWYDKSVSQWRPIESSGAELVQDPGIDGTFILALPTAESEDPR